jgi:hypothetical protein
MADGESQRSVVRAVPSGNGREALILQQVVPGLTRVAFLNDLGTPPGQANLEEARKAAPQLGLQLQILDVRSETDIEPTFASARLQEPRPCTRVAAAPNS